MIEKPLMLTILKIVRESPRVKSYYFNHRLNASPGQFIMLWVPGIGERPVAVLEDRSGFLLSVAKVGKVSEALHNLKKGDRVGIRGPLGHGFSLPRKKGEIVMVAGGYGIVPLAFLAIQAKKQGFRVVVLNGARTKEEVLYQDFFQKYKIKMLTSTDNGSLGKKGFVSDLLKEYLAKHQPIKVYCCGPELMEVSVANILWRTKIPFEVSLERYMKCGIGVCGSCSVDPTGWRICVEGPILSENQLKKVIEFGKYHRTASGKIEYFKK